MERFGLDDVGRDMEKKPCRQEVKAGGGLFAMALLAFGPAAGTRRASLARTHGVALAEKSTDKNIASN